MRVVEHKRVETVDSSGRTGPARWGTSGPGPLLFLGAAWVWRRWVKRRRWFRPSSAAVSSRTIPTHIYTCYHASTCLYANANESVAVNCLVFSASNICQFCCFLPWIYLYSEKHCVDDKEKLSKRNSVRNDHFKAWSFHFDSRYTKCKDLGLFFSWKLYK